MNKTDENVRIYIRDMSEVTIAILCLIVLGLLAFYFAVPIRFALSFSALSIYVLAAALWVRSNRTIQW
jgi:hypothetical protein